MLEGWCSNSCHSRKIMKGFSKSNRIIDSSAGQPPSIVCRFQGHFLRGSVLLLRIIIFRLNASWGGAVSEGTVNTFIPGSCAFPSLDLADPLPQETDLSIKSPWILHIFNFYCCNIASWMPSNCHLYIIFKRWSKTLGEFMKGSTDYFFLFKLSLIQNLKK